MAWRCLSLSESNFKDIVISLPQYLLNEVDRMIQHDNVNREDLIHRATRNYVYERKKVHIHDTMRQGYEEMARINLNIASEAFHAEAEAENKLDHPIDGV